MRTRVENHPNLVRNETGAIINTDRESAAAYKKRREVFQKQQVDNAVFRSSINKINDEIVGIKELLAAIMDKLEKKL